MKDNAPVIQGGVTAGALIALFKALLIAFKAMGWLGLDDTQSSAWEDVAEIAFPILVTAFTTWWIARRTTSLAQPTDVDGVRMIRADDKRPAIKEQEAIDKAIFDRSIQRQE